MNDHSHKKILFVITKSNWGGAQAYVYTLATQFKDSGAEVVVALGGTGLPGASAGLLGEKLARAGIRTIFVPAFARDIRFFTEFFALSQLRKIIRAERPDVLHLNSSKAGGVGTLAGRLEKVPRIIFTSHGLAYDEDVSAFTRFFRLFATWATILLSHVTIMLSKDTCERANALPFCRRKIRLVYNGLTPGALWPRHEARKRLVPKDSKERTWIGTIGELTRNKATDTLISVAVNLKSRGRDFTMVIIGEGEEHARLAQLVADANLGDSVHLVGFVPDAGNLLSAFDIFTLVSTKEGLPYVLLEAGRAGCAVVATSIPGNTDIIDSETGILVTPKAIKEIADGLEVLLTHEEKRRALGAALHTRVQEKFSIANMLDQTAALYRLPA